MIFFFYMFSTFWIPKVLWIINNEHLFNFLRILLFIEHLDNSFSSCNICIRRSNNIFNYSLSIFPLSPQANFYTFTFLPYFHTSENLVGEKYCEIESTPKNTSSQNKMKITNQTYHGNMKAKIYHQILSLHLFGDFFWRFVKLCIWNLLPSISFHSCSCCKLYCWSATWIYFLELYCFRFFEVILSRDNPSFKQNHDFHFALY